MVRRRRQTGGDVGGDDDYSLGAQLSRVFGGGHDPQSSGLDRAIDNFRIVSGQRGGYHPDTAPDSSPGAPDYAEDPKNVFRYTRGGKPRKHHAGKITGRTARRRSDRRPRG